MTLTALASYISAVDESIQLLQACNVLIRCLDATAALGDSANGLLRTAEGQHASIPPGLPASFDADVHQIAVVAQTLFSVYQNGAKPAAADLETANQVITTFNADVAAGGLGQAPAPTLAPH